MPLIWYLIAYGERRENRLDYEDFDPDELPF